MQAYRIERFGSVDGIELRSSDDPRPGLREVLMRVRASSLNYRDLMVLKGGGSRSHEARRDTAIRRRRRGRSNRRRGNTGAQFPRQSPNSRDPRRTARFSKATGLRSLQPIWSEGSLGLRKLARQDDYHGVAKLGARMGWR